MGPMGGLVCRKFAGARLPNASTACSKVLVFVGLNIPATPIHSPSLGLSCVKVKRITRPMRGIISW
jgi:hypothetical protein